MVGLAQRLLGGVLLVEQSGDDVHVDVEQRAQRPGVGDVLHEHAFARLAEVVVAELRERDADEVDVVADQGRIERPGGVVQEIAALAHFANVARVGLRVHRDHQVVIERARGVAVFVDADLVPGGQALDVGREQVFAGDGNAHAEDGLHDEAVGAGRSGSVDVGQFDGEIVYAGTHASESTGLPAYGINSSNFCMSHAAVGQRSAHRPQCTHRSSSLAMMRPVWGSGAET